MSKASTFCKAVASSSTIEIDPIDVEVFAPHDIDFRAGDLARKHGISVDRAQMLVDRFGANRLKLEGAAQALRSRLD